MALELVTIDEVMAQSHLDGDAHELWLETWIPIISHAVAAWLKDEWRLYEESRDSNGEIIRDSSGDPIPALDDEGLPVPHPLARGAVLVEIDNYFRNRDGSGRDNVVPSDAGYGYMLNKASTNLLASRRKTTLR